MLSVSEGPWPRAPTAPTLPLQADDGRGDKGAALATQGSLDAYIYGMNAADSGTCEREGREESGGSVCWAGLQRRRRARSSPAARQAPCCIMLHCSLPTPLSKRSPLLGRAHPLCGACRGGQLLLTCLPVACLHVAAPPAGRACRAAAHRAADFSCLIFLNTTQVGKSWVRLNRPLPYDVHPQWQARGAGLFEAGRRWQGLCQPVCARPILVRRQSPLRQSPLSLPSLCCRSTFMLLMPPCSTWAGRTLASSSSGVRVWMDQGVTPAADSRCSRCPTAHLHH